MQRKCAPIGASVVFAGLFVEAIFETIDAPDEPLSRFFDPCSQGVGMCDAGSFVTAPNVANDGLRLSEWGKVEFTPEPSKVAEIGELWRRHGAVECAIMLFIGRATAGR